MKRLKVHNAEREKEIIKTEIRKTQETRLQLIVWTVLTNGTTYVLKVAAYNEYFAESDASDYVYATPYQASSQASMGSERKILCFLGVLSD